MLGPSNAFGDHHFPNRGSFHNGQLHTSNSIVIAAPILDPCPAFAPQTYSQWKREIKLRVAAQQGATESQLLSKVIMVLPQPAKVSGLTYMERTEITPEIRKLSDFMMILDERFGKTDSEKSWAWLNAFTEFSRTSGGNFKGFRARFFRCANRLEALNMKLSDQMIFNKALQSLRLPGNQTPIATSAMETRNAPNDVQASKEITIRMYETHKPSTDRSDVFVASTPPIGDPESSEGNTPSTATVDQSGHTGGVTLPAIDENEITDEWEDESSYEWADPEGVTYLLRQKRPISGRNQPGQMITDTRGSIANFKGVKNGKSSPKGKGKRHLDASDAEPAIAIGGSAHSRFRHKFLWEAKETW